MYLFNIVMKEPELRCRSWGTRIRLRLSRVEAWAEKQGLELAAECHLARVTQAMNLLKGSKGRFLMSHRSFLGHGRSFGPRLHFRCGLDRPYHHCAQTVPSRTGGLGIHASLRNLAMRMEFSKNEKLRNHK